MCRWMAYSGDPILVDDLLFRPQHSIIDQSLHAQLGAGVKLETLDRLGPDTRFIVSEPLRDLPGAWNEVPEGSWALVRRGEQDSQPFEPTIPG